MMCWTFNNSDRPDFAWILKALDRLPKKPLHRSPSHPIHISRSAESVFTWQTSDMGTSAILCDIAMAEALNSAGIHPTTIDELASYVNVQYNFSIQDEEYNYVMKITFTQPLLSGFGKLYLTVIVLKAAKPSPQLAKDKLCVLMHVKLSQASVWIFCVFLTREVQNISFYHFLIDHLCLWGLPLPVVRTCSMSKKKF